MGTNKAAARPLACAGGGKTQQCWLFCTGSQHSAGQATPPSDGELLYRVRPGQGSSFWDAGHRAPSPETYSRADLEDRSGNKGDAFNSTE